jgi:hypothetical protein
MSFLRNKMKLVLKNPFKTPVSNPSQATKGPLESVVAKSPEPVVTEPKIKLRTKMFNYLKNIYIDYKDVSVHTVKSMNERPFRALGYGLLTTAALVFYKKNPTRLDYENRRVELANELIMCGRVHSARSEYYLNEISKLDNLGLIEYRSFIFFSLILVRKTNEFDCNYENRCAPLTNPNKFNIFNSVNLFLKAISRVADIGFCDEWWNLNRNFVDYDVDEREWVDKKENFAI